MRTDGRNWARTSDPQLVELVLSQLSYAPAAVSLASCLSAPTRYATGAAGGGTGTGGCCACAAAGVPMPFARIVASNVSRLV